MHAFNKEERQRFLRLLIYEAIYTGTSVRIKGAIPIQSERADAVVPADDPASEWQDSVVSGIAATRMAPRTASSDRIGNTKLYRDSPNSVTEVPFEISRDLPQQPPPLRDRLKADYLRALIEWDPRCTLQQLCDWVYEERGFTLSKTEMCRLVKSYGLQRKRSHRPHIYPKRPLLVAA